MAESIRAHRYGTELRLRKSARSPEEEGLLAGAVSSNRLGSSDSAASPTHIPSPDHVSSPPVSDVESPFIQSGRLPFARGEGPAHDPRGGSVRQTFRSDAAPKYVIASFTRALRADGARTGGEIAKAYPHPDAARSGFPVTCGAFETSAPHRTLALARLDTEGADGSYIAVMHDAVHPQRRTNAAGVTYENLGNAEFEMLKSRLRRTVAATLG